MVSGLAVGADAGDVIDCEDAVLGVVDGIGDGHTSAATAPMRPQFLEEPLNLGASDAVGCVLEEGTRPEAANITVAS